MLLPETFTLSSVLLFAFIGFVIGFFFHHIILYFYTRERSYLYYAIYTFALSLGILSIADGMNASWGKSYDLIPIGYETLFLQFYHVSLILITLHINNIHYLFPKLYRFSLYVSVVTALGLIFLMLGDEGIFLTSVFSMIAFSLSLALTIYALYRRVPESKYYFVAFFPFLITVFIHAAAVNAMLDFTDDFSKGVVIGAVWNISALAILIAQKIRFLSDEKDRALMENTVHNATLFLNSRNTAMGELVADIAHQWKQPLNAIASVQNALKASIVFSQGVSKEVWLESTETSIRLIEHLGNTIDTFYRFLTPKVTENRIFCITDQFITIERLTEYAFKNSNITLKFHYDSHPTLEGDPNEFVHVLLNIILNAKEVLENNAIPSPYIDVTLSKTAQGYIIRIADNGGGIKIDPIELIFERYISNKNEGGGLGLYMAHEIITKRFGGVLSAENSSNGAIFTILLPYEASIEIPQPHKDSNQDQMKRLAQKVLQLEQSEEELRLWADIFEHAHWAIAVHIPYTGRFKNVNHAFSQLYGYSIDEVSTMTAMDLFPEQTMQQYFELKEIVDTHGYGSMSTLHKRKDGSTFPVSVQVMITRNADGSPRYLIANFWDKTEEIANQDNLIKLGHALNMTSDAVYLIDTDARFLYVNNAACMMLGYTQEELLEMRVFDIDPDYTQEVHQQNNDTFFKDSNFKATFEAFHITKNRNLIPVEITSTLFWNGGSPLIISTVRDITQRIESNKQLHLLNSAINRTSEAIFINDETLIIIYVNEGACNMLGYSRNELIGMSILEIDALVKPEDLHNLHGKLLNGNVVSVESKHQTKSGTIIDVEISSNVFEYDGKNIALSIVKNISERKQSAEALQSSEAKYRAIVENTPDIIIRYDLSMHRIYINPNFERILGISVQSFMGVSPSESEFLLDPEIFESLFKQTVEMKIIQSYETLFHNIKGEEIWAELRFIPETDYDGIVTGVILIAADITSRVLSERQLRMIETAINNTAEAIYISNQELSFIYVNDGACRMLGYSRDELLCMNVADIDAVHTLEEIRHIKSLKSTLQNVSIETKHRCKNGSIIDVAIVGNTFVYNDEQIIVSIANDITERKNDLNKLRTSEELYRTLVESSNDYIARYDKNGNLIYMNQKLKFFLSVSVDIIGNMPLFEHTDYLEYDKVLLQVITSGENSECYLKLFDEERNISYHHVCFVAERDSHGIIIGALAIGRDISEITAEKEKLKHHNMLLEELVLHRTTELRELNEKLEQRVEERTNQLRKSEAMFRAIVENSPDVISRYDLEMKRIYVNPMMQFLLAKPLDQILGKTPRDFSPLPDTDLFEKSFHEVVKTKKEVEYESYYRSPWGEHRWGLNRFIPEIDIDGSIQAVMVVGKDITQYKQTLTQLQSTTNSLSALINTIPDMVWMKNPEGVYLTCNQAFEEFFGAKSYEIIGKTDYDFVDRELADFFRQKDMEAIEKGTININEETITYKSSGIVARLETRKVPVYDSNGALLGVLGIGRDISAFFSSD